MPLDALIKQYSGAYAEGFDWPQPSPHRDEDMDEAEGPSAASLSLHTESKRLTFSFFLV